MADDPARSDHLRETMDITLHVDGEPRSLTVDTRTTVLDALREQLGVTAPKKGCDHGQCGSCTCIVDGRRVTTCLSLAVAYDGAQITTADGLAADGELHPLAQAFVDHDALSVRLLHARPDLLRGRDARRGAQRLSRAT